ncbi:alpha/beta-hydrolase [Artomyces pyxidatus]|uniref:Alpha/beta-hydrolase n=1 Tax=Artomyces pyxidatus TaxID=48021 RepID=A0ACB8SPD3_9AGAM|nr:alpha/beta-hydrolase [Artomyces pyxidatus]
MQGALLTVLASAVAAAARAAQQPLEPVDGIAQDTYNELHRFAQYSSAVYQPLCPRPLGNALVESFSNILTHVHGFVARDDARRELVVAFRGSQQLSDMVTDANLMLVPLALHGIPPETTSDAEIHAGFLIAYNSVCNMVVSAVREELDVYPDYSVVAVGHSMGGALASIASLSLKYHIPSAAVRLFTYGMLYATGNAGFADLMHDMIGDANMYRARNIDGVSTLVPESLGYRHHATEYWQHAEPPDSSTVRQCEGQEDPECSKSILSTGINTAHFVYFGQMMTVDATLCL